MLSVASLIDTPIVVMLSVIVLCVLALFKKKQDSGLIGNSQHKQYSVVMLSVMLFIVMSGPIISSGIMLSVTSLIDMPIVIILSVVVLCVSVHFKKSC